MVMSVFVYALDASRSESFQHLESCLCTVKIPSVVERRTPESTGLEVSFLVRFPHSSVHKCRRIRQPAQSGTSRIRCSGLRGRPKHDLGTRTISNFWTMSASVMRTTNKQIDLLVEVLHNWRLPKTGRCRLQGATWNHELTAQVNRP